VAAGPVHGREHHRGRPVRGGADLQQAQGVGHHGAGQHLLGGDLLAVPGVGVVQAVTGVLHLHLGEVGVGGPVEVDAAPGVEREVGGVGGAQQPEPQPVRVVPALPGVGGEEALRRGVGTHHQGHVAEAGQDAGAGRLERGGPGGAGGVAGGDPRPVPAQGLGHGRPRHVAGIAVADGLAAGDEAHVGPVHPGVVQRGQRGLDAVGGEAPAPLAPGVHAHPGDGDIGDHQPRSPAKVGAVVGAAVGFQRQIRCSTPSSSTWSGSTTSSTGSPTRRSSTP
jgi:hypothetical protein